MYLATHEGEPPTGDLHPQTHAHAGRTPLRRGEAQRRPTATVGPASRRTLGVSLDNFLVLPNKGAGIMEFTEDLLKRIAGHIASLRLQFGLIRAVLIQMGTNPDEFDKITRQALEGPTFQKARDLVLEELWGGH